MARSLASLAIDLNYLSAKDADRFVTFRATGREARRRMAEQCGFAPPDAAATDWDDVKARAKRWKQGGAIYERATKADCLRCTCVTIVIMSWSSSDLNRKWTDVRSSAPWLPGLLARPGGNVTGVQTAAAAGG